MANDGTLPTAPGQYAVVTAVASHNWETYLVFHEALRRQAKQTLVIVDLGLTRDQLAHLTTQLHTRVVTLANYDQLVKFGSDWRSWFKPYYILNCGADYVLWLDVESVVLKSLDPLFTAIEQQPLLLHDHRYGDYAFNDPKLHDEYGLPALKASCVLGIEMLVEPGRLATVSTSTLGVALPRDRLLLEQWLERIWEVQRNPKIKPWIHCADQGVLQWVLTERDELTTLQNCPAWNQPGRRNLYETGQRSYRWPTGHHSGGDLLNNLRIDNTDATIINYHTPKLLHLCEVNNQVVQSAYRHTNGTAPTRLFVLGLERCGTHTLAEVTRRACAHWSWIRHEFTPVLAHEAQQKVAGNAYKTPAFQDHVNFWQRTDCALICEANHRLTFFIDDLYSQFPDAKFVLLLRSPLQVFRSRLYNFTHWPGYLQRLPGFYQFDCRARSPHFCPELSEMNQCRPAPPNYLDWPLAELHAWEIEMTLATALASLRQLPPESYRICFIETFAEQVRSFVRWVGPHLINHRILQNALTVKYGERTGHHSPQTIAWIEDQVQHGGLRILIAMTKLFKQYGLEWVDDPVAGHHWL